MLIAVNKYNGIGVGKTIVTQAKIISELLKHHMYDKAIYQLAKLYAKCSDVGGLVFIIIHTLGFDKFRKILRKNTESHFSRLLKNIYGTQIEIHHYQKAVEEMIKLEDDEFKIVGIRIMVRYCVESQNHKFIEKNSKLLGGNNLSKIHPKYDHDAICRTTYMGVSIDDAIEKISNDDNYTCNIMYPYMEYHVDEWEKIKNILSEPLFWKLFQENLKTDENKKILEAINRIIRTVILSLPEEKHYILENLNDSFDKKVFDKNTLDTINMILYYYKMSKNTELLETMKLITDRMKDKFNFSVNLLKSNTQIDPNEIIIKCTNLLENDSSTDTDTKESAKKLYRQSLSTVYYLSHSIWEYVQEICYSEALFKNNISSVDTTTISDKMISELFNMQMNDSGLFKWTIWGDWWNFVELCMLYKKPHMLAFINNYTNPFIMFFKKIWLWIIFGISILCLPISLSINIIKLLMSHKIYNHCK